MGKGVLLVIIHSKGINRRQRGWRQKGGQDSEKYAWLLTTVEGKGISTRLVSVCVSVVTSAGPPATGSVAVKVSVSTMVTILPGAPVASVVASWVSVVVTPPAGITSVAVTVTVITMTEGVPAGGAAGVGVTITVATAPWLVVVAPATVMTTTDGEGADGVWTVLATVTIATDGVGVEGASSPPVTVTTTTETTATEVPPDAAVSPAAVTVMTVTDGEGPVGAVSPVTVKTTTLGAAGCDTVTMMTVCGVGPSMVVGAISPGTVMDTTGVMAAGVAGMVAFDEVVAGVASDDDVDDDNVGEMVVMVELLVSDVARAPAVVAAVALVCGAGREGEGVNVIEAVMFQFDADVTFGASVDDKTAVTFADVTLEDVALGKMVISAAGTPVGEEGVGN